MKSTWLLALEKAEAFNYAVVRFGFTTGLRAAELLSLRWDNISEENDELWVRFKGKGGRQEKVRVERAALRAVKAAKRSDERLFPIGYGALNKRVAKHRGAAKSAGIIRREVKFTCHLLRRSCATDLKRQGVDLVAIQRHLRHRSIKTTVEFYV